MNNFWSWVKNEETGIDELELKGPIAEESWWGDEMTPAAFKAELSEFKGKNITVWINSPGGDVFAASQIYTMLMEHQGEVTIKIDGYAMSAATVIAMAGTNVQIAPTGIIMIHNPWTFAMGDSKDLEHMADVLNEVKESIINAYELKTGLNRKEISKLMDAETYMNANKALELGFVDEVLYTEKEQGAQNAFAFSRGAAYNSLMAKMIKKPAKVRAEPNQKPNNTQEILDLQQKLIKNIERRFKI